MDYRLVTVACLAAFAGFCLSERLLKKLAIRSAQILVSILLIGVASGSITSMLSWLILRPSEAVIQFLNFFASSPPSPRFTVLVIAPPFSRLRYPSV